MNVLGHCHAHPQPIQDPSTAFLQHSGWDQEVHIKDCAVHGPVHRPIRTLSRSTIWSFDSSLVLLLEVVCMEKILFLKGQKSLVYLMGTNWSVGVRMFAG